MYFVRSGVIHTHYGSLLYAGYANHSWSSTPHPTDNRYAFYLLFDPTTAESSTSNNRYYAFPLSHESFSMYFVRSGSINLPTGSLWFASNAGDIWSSTAHTASTQAASYIGFNSGTTAPSDRIQRSLGYTLQNSSTYFVRSGYIDLPRDSLKNAGYTGNVWSATAYPANSQANFYITFDISTAFLSNSSNHHYGLPLRNLNINISSIYFVRSGYIYFPYGALRSASINGHFWSSSAHFADLHHVSFLNFNSATIYPSNDGDRCSGLPLRNPISITLHCISSVVTSSIFHIARSDMQTVAPTIGHPPATPPISTPRLTFTSILPIPLHQTTTIAIAASPFKISIFISLLSISSVVALFSLHLAHFRLPVAMVAFGHPQLRPQVSTMLNISSIIQTKPIPPPTTAAGMASPSVFISLRMYFVRSGDMHPSRGTLRHAGMHGYIWSSTAFPLDIRYASYLYLDHASTLPSNHFHHYYGYSLRNLVSISLPCISSVVALLTFSAAHSDTAPMPSSSTPQHPNPPTTNPLSTLCSILPAPIHPSLPNAT